MAKLVLSDLVSLSNQTTAVTTINNNSDAIETAMENTLSRDGTTPNQMGAQLDMNSYRIINLVDPVNDHEPATRGYILDLIEDLEVAASFPSINDVTKAPFNVDNTGATSAVTGLQAAVNAGGLVYLPKGRYKVDSSITVSNPVFILGVGDDKTIVGDQGTYIDVVGDAVDAFIVLDNNVAFENLSIIGSGATRASSRSNGSGIVVGSQATLGATVTTNGTTTITAASSVFTAADVGKYIRIAGAGTEGAANYFYGVIQSQAGTTAVLNAAPPVSAGGLTAVLGINVFNLQLNKVASVNHGIGVEVIAANRYIFNECHFHGFDCLHSNNIISVDSGDSIIDNCLFYTSYNNSSPTDNVNLTHNSGGGLRITNSKFLDCLDSIRISWTNGISGGLVMTNNSLENCFGDQIDISGDSSDAAILGLTLAGNWINGGLTQLKIADTIIIRDLQITGNNFQNGGGTNMIRIGALVNGFNISSNTLNGNAVGSSLGIDIRSGASNGIVLGNRIHNITTRYTNSGTNTYVYDTGNDGIFTTPVLLASSGTFPLQSVNTTNGALVEVQRLSGSRSAPANNDAIYQSWFLKNNAASNIEYARITATASDVVAGSEDGSLSFLLRNAGSLGNSYFMSHSQFSPLTDGGANLGAGTLAWDNLFLDTGAVINWDNGNVVATHSVGVVNFTTGDLRVTTAGTDSQSVVTVGGTQTLTNKTLSSPTVTGTMTLSGGQIAFPATQSASSDPNTLDDYEEGTWTPVLTADTPGDLTISSYSEQLGIYTKIGRFVHIAFGISISAGNFTHTTASGLAKVTGLPFTVGTSTNIRHMAALNWQGITKAGYGQIVARADFGGTVCLFAASASGVGLSNVAITEMPTGGAPILRGGVVYNV